MPHLSAVSNRIRRRPISSFRGGEPIGGGAFIPIDYLDTDGTLAANSDTKVATQKATKTYADSLVASATVVIGNTRTLARRGDDGRRALLIPGPAGASTSTTLQKVAPGRLGEDGRRQPIIPGQPGTNGRDGTHGRRGDDSRRPMVIVGVNGTNGRDGVSLMGRQGESGRRQPMIPGQSGANGRDGVVLLGRRGADGRRPTLQSPSSADTSTALANTQRLIFLGL